LWELWQTALLPWQKSLPCRLAGLFVQAAASSDMARQRIALIRISPLHTHSTAHATPAHAFSTPFLTIVAGNSAALAGSIGLAAGRIVGAGRDD
jgi:hypothetical protein